MMARMNRLASQWLLRGRHLRGAWDEFWFSAADVAPLAAIRVCTGLVLLFIYGAIAADVQSYLGPHAWVAGQREPQGREIPVLARPRIRSLHRVIHHTHAMLECHERSTFIPILANSFASRTCEIEVGHAERSVGGSKYDLWKLVNLQFDLLTSMTTFPLRALSLLGIAVSVAGVGFGIFLLVMRLIYGSQWAVQGVFTLFAVLFIYTGATKLFGIPATAEFIAAKAAHGVSK
jgi:hypothetical protein